MRKWEHLPDEMRNQEVLYYYEELKKKVGGAGSKTLF